MTPAITPMLIPAISPPDNAASEADAGSCISEGVDGDVPVTELDIPTGKLLMS